MANYQNLLNTINGAIRTNGTGAITGQLLQTVLDGMVASLGAKYQYAGVATPATNPGTPDENVFYLATQAGTYTNFGGLVVNDGEVCALKWDGTWTKDITGAATAEQVSQLGQKIDVTLQDVKSILNNIDYLRNYLINDEVETGKYINPNSGAIGFNSDWTTSSFISIEPSTEYIIDGMNPLFGAFYNESKEFISESGINDDSGNLIISSPETAKYLRISTLTAKFGNSSVRKYADVQFALNNLISIKIQQVIGLTDRLEEIVPYIISGVIDLSGFVSTDGKYINPSNGNYGTNEGSTSSDYIPIVANKTYTFSGFSGLQGALYDSSKQYISGFSATTEQTINVLMPNNAAFIRYSTVTTSFESVAISMVLYIDEKVRIKLSQVDGCIEKFEEVVPCLTNEKINLLSISKVSGKYINPSNGTLGTYEDSTASDYIKIVSNTKYIFAELSGVQIAFYDSNKQYLSGFSSNGVQTYLVTAPSDALYMRFSTVTSSYDNVDISVVLYLNNKINVSIQQIDGLSKRLENTYNTTKITVNPHGGGDFTTLSSAFDSISNPSYYNRYIVEFVGDGTEYDLLDDKEYIQGEIGLRIPPFTKLIGKGGSEKCILTRRLNSPDIDDSVINMYSTSEIDGLTLIGLNTRYVVHDDYYDNWDGIYDYERCVKNCIFIGESLATNCIYGAGVRSGSVWRFENCIFKNADGANNASFGCHNNVYFSRPAIQKFVNCRFEAVSNQNICVSFGTLNTNANGIVNTVLLYGNYLVKLQLVEQNALTYGAGILFKVSGFSNNLKTGGQDISIVNTDGVDYSDRINLI